MHMYHHLSTLFPRIPHKPRITKKRRFRKREIVVNNSIRMQSKHLLPFLIFLYQGRNTMPSSLIQILLTQFKMQVVLLPVITDNKLRNRRNTTHILLRIKRRRSYNNIHKSFSILTSVFFYLSFSHQLNSSREQES